MTHDCEKKKEEENITALEPFAGGLTQAIDHEEEANEAITEEDALPLAELNNQLTEFVKQGRMRILQKATLQLDLEGAPKESKFAQAKRNKKKVEVDYESLDVKELANRVDPGGTSREEAKPETKGNTERWPVVVVPAEASAKPEIEPRADSTMPGSNRPTPTPPAPSIGKTTVPETPAALAKVRMKTMPGMSEDANQNEEWAKKQQEFAADQKQAKELLEKKVFNAVVSLDKKSAPSEGMLNSRVALPTIPVKDVGKEKRGVARRTWGVYAGAAAVVGFVVIAGVVMWRLDGKKDVVPSVASAVSVASEVPEAVSPPPPSATSPPTVQVAESDASRVAERHDAGNAASAPTVMVTVKPMVREKEHRHDVVTPTTPVPTRHKPEKPTPRPTHEDPDTVL